MIDKNVAHAKTSSEPHGKLTEKN